MRELQVKALSERPILPWRDLNRAIQVSILHSQGAHSGIGMPGHGRMLFEEDRFWQYAKEALLSACYDKTNEDKQNLLDLART